MCTVQIYRGCVCVLRIRNNWQAISPLKSPQKSYLKSPQNSQTPPTLHNGHYALNARHSHSHNNFSQYFSSFFFNCQKLKINKVNTVRCQAPLPPRSPLPSFNGLCFSECQFFVSLNALKTKWLSFCNYSFNLHREKTY